VKRAVLAALALAIAVPAHPQSVEQRIAAYKHRVDLLEAQNAIEDLQATYGYYFDKGLWDQAAALFAPAGSFEYGQRGVYIGVARIRRAMLLFGPQGLAAGHLNNHMMLQPVITVADDGRSAKARWQGMIMLAQPGQNGVWRIKSLHLYVNFVAPYEKGWARLKPGEGLVRSAASVAMPPDRPPTVGYKAFPDTFVPPFHAPNPVTGKRVETLK
jgi:hypothetical protein